MKIGEYEFPDDLYYEKNHHWARLEGDLVVMGVTDFAQKMAREIIYAELPRLGRHVEQGKPFSSIESGKWVGRVYAPVSGTITAANKLLDDDAAWINKDPYCKGWIAKIKPDNLDELKNLLRADDTLVAFIQSETEKIKRGEKK